MLPKPLGILARAEPSSEELVYARHECGFALFSRRSPSITRLSLQCSPDEPLATWTDDRIWDELTTRLGSANGWRPNRREILQRGVTAMRSFVAEPMHRGRMFLAGDAAHIVPPTGAKGLNLAAADVAVLVHALGGDYRENRRDLLEGDSERCLGRVWCAQRLSCG